MHPVLKGFLCLLAMGAVLAAAGAGILVAAFTEAKAFYTPFLMTVGILVQGLTVCSFFNLLRKAWLRRAWLAVLGGAVAVFGIYNVALLYDASVPRLYDRSVRVEDYAPFAPGTKAASLDGPASLRIEARPDAPLPRLDGATALYPLYAAFARAVYPPGDYPVEDGPVAFHNTIGAYPRLLNGHCDMIFVAGPSRGQEREAGFAGTELTLTPIGKEAFVFFVNDANPVDGLTQDQLRDIYAGAVTRWSRVGGGWRGIVAFQRNEGSGSQSEFLRFMGDRKPMTPPGSERLDFMSGVVRRTSDYANYGNALGFSFRYFVREMMEDAPVKLLAVDGVRPTPESVRNGTYPLAAKFYAVTRANESNPNVRRLLAWILSPEGQALVERTGYCPVFGASMETKTQGSAE